MKSTSKSENARKQVKAKVLPTSTAKGKEESKKGGVSDPFGRPNVAVKTPEVVPEGTLEGPKTPS